MKKIIEYFHLNNIGALELFFAFFPILSQYNWGSLYGEIVALAIMVFISVFKGIRPFFFKPLLLFLIFFILHEIPIVIGYNGNIYGFLQQIISMLAIFFIVPALRYDKLIGPLYLVGILSMGGLLYHYLLLVSGNLGDIHPITLPFLPELSSESRAMEVIVRPSSFFWEPASYVTYMMIPLFLSMHEKKYAMTFAIVFFNLLSGSTNGIFLSFAILLFYVLAKSTRIFTKVMIVVAGIAMSYFFFNSDLFEQGVEKMENTEVDSNQRLHNGRALISAMPLQHIILGFPADNVTSYYRSDSRISSSTIIPSRLSGNVFVSDLWRVLAKFGIFGYILFWNIYLWFYKKDKSTRPYILTLIVAMISQSLFLGAFFTFQMMVLLTYVNRDNLHLTNKIKYA